MKVTEQIDALKLMEIDEITYLVIPRFIGCAIAGSCLTLISIFSSLFCAMLTAIWSYQFSCVEYVNVMAKFLKPSDLLLGLLKGSLYGAVIPLIACYNGINCKQGAQEVGTVTTNSVVYSMAMIIILDFIVTYLFAIFYF
jgi:phospholipid/cholesterol/gamma-HCH transport system permease protein